MINCTQCGKMNIAGTAMCQSCGAPLSSMVDGGMSPRPVPSEQPELPAWLESLRAGERSASPVNTAANFSPADFVDEYSLPSWMRAERNEARDNTGANPPVSVRPSSLPSPNPNSEQQPPTGIAARSLLDEQALPSWMREGKQSGPIPAQGKFAASSLVQPENVPDWMKSLQKDKASFPGETGGGRVPPPSTSTSSQMPPQRYAGASPDGSPPLPITPAELSGQSGFSARDLIDPQSLPSWMVQQGERTGQPTRSSQMPPQRPAGASPDGSPPLPITPAELSGQSGFSARDLIDPQSLPSWMVQQGERTGQPTRSSQVSQPETFRHPGQPAQGPTLPASSLLDANSLPSWLHENALGGQTQGQSAPFANQPLQAPPPMSGGTIPASSFLDINSAPEWMRQVDPQQSKNGLSAPPPMSGGTIPASSFLDINSAPEWMRQVDPQQPNSGLNTPPQYDPMAPPVPRTSQPNTYAGPPRVENMRVPNRPRREVNPNESSEVAANVFSSMLGVASSTPNYPVPSSQPQSSYQQPSLPGNPAQPNMGYPMSQSGMSPSGAANYADLSASGMSSNTPQGYAPSNSYGKSYQGGMSSSQVSNMPSSASTSYASNSVIPGQKTANVANEQKNTKKRGLFGAILEWLTR